MRDKPLEFRGSKLEFSLQHHSPLIAYVGSETKPVWTLRGTELKPRLDAYIKSKLSPKLDGLQSLPYKISIKEKASRVYKHVRDIEDYFAKEIIEEPKRVKKPSQNHHKMIVTDPVVTIICFDKACQGYLLTYLESFFIVTNFGHRQSKGFGSFTIKGLPQAELANQASQVLREHYGCCYRFEIEDRNKRFETYKLIDSFYRYLTREGLRSYQKLRRNGNLSGRDSRPLLSLTNQYKSESRQIQRHASSVIFKIIGSDVYLLPRKIDSRLYDTRFKKKGRPVMTPDQKGFDLVNFLDFAIEEWNGSQPKKTKIKGL